MYKIQCLLLRMGVVRAQVVTSGAIVPPTLAGLVDAAAPQNSTKAKSEKVMLRAKTLSLSDFMGPFLH